MSERSKLRKQLIGDTHMASLTAQLLIGSPHPNDGGIIPSHYLFLSENDVLLGV